VGVDISKVLEELAQLPLEPMITLLSSLHYRKARHVGCLSLYIHCIASTTND